MREEVDVRVRERAAHPARHLGPRLLEHAVDRRDDQVELGEQLVGIVERAVRPDVALGAGEHADSRMATPGCPDAPHVRAHLAWRETACHPRRRTVIGHRDVFVAPRVRRVHERVDRRGSVGRLRVTVQVAPDVLEAHEHREPAGAGRLDLSRVLTQLRRDPWQADRRVDLLLRRARDPPAALLPEDTVLRDPETALHPELAHPDVVLLRAREVRERRAEARRRDDPEIDLDPLAMTDRRLRTSRLQDLDRLGEVHEGVDRPLRARRDGEEIDVPDGFLPPPDRACHFHAADAGHAPECPRELLGERERLPERHPLLPPAHDGDALQDVLLGLGLDSREPVELPGPRQRLESRQAPDTFALVEQLGGLRPDTRHVEERDHTGRDAAFRRLDLLHLPGLEVLDDLAGEVLPDSRHVIEPPLARDDLHVLRERLDVLRCPAVGADAKHVRPAQLEHVGHEVEEPRDLEVLHPIP